MSQEAWHHLNELKKIGRLSMERLLCLLKGKEIDFSNNALNEGCKTEQLATSLGEPHTGDQPIDSVTLTESSRAQATPFFDWYSQQWVSRYKWYLQLPIWYLYGYIWIPVWYFCTATPPGNAWRRWQSLPAHKFFGHAQP